MGRTNMAIGHLQQEQGLPDVSEFADEALLVSHAQAGDVEAFAELYRRYRTQVLALALARKVDFRLAEEITQETFLRALRGLARFDTSREFGPWLRTIAANLVVDAHRRRERTELKKDEELVVVPSIDPVEAVLAAEGVRDVHDALRALSPRQRRILLSATLGELSPAELARRENVSEASVTSVVYRARLSIRRTLRRLATVVLVFRTSRSRVRNEAVSMTGVLPATTAEAALSGLVLSVALIVAVPPAPWVREPAPMAPVVARTDGAAIPVPDDFTSVSRTRVPQPPSAAGPRLPVENSVHAPQPEDGKAGPSSGRVAVAVVGPDGSTIVYQDTTFECEGEPAVTMPAASPVKSSC